jgi:hypothetical protein
MGIIITFLALLELIRRRDIEEISVRRAEYQEEGDGEPFGPTPPLAAG